MKELDGQPARRVRPHVAEAIARAHHVLLDFDGVMFDVESALGPWARENAIHDYLRTRPYFPRPIILGAFGVDHMLGFIAEHQPDYLLEAEEALAGRELDAALTAKPAHGLRQLLAACAATRRKVGVISDLAEDAVVATVRSHQLDLHVNAISARQGFDLAAFDAGHTADRAADLLGVPISSCLFVGGRWARIRATQEAGAVGLGCECGREPRKYLASPQVPVVPNLATLIRALLDNS
jgi:beta-phosphoglucomutase-like phosphatase (HAD superfamily)